MDGLLKRQSKKILRDLGVMKRLPSQVIPPKDCRRFDCSRVSWQKDNHLIYRRHLDQGSVHFNPSQECWVILGYADQVDIMTRHESFSSEFTSGFDPFLAGADGELHRGFRRLMRPIMSVDKKQMSDYVNHWMDDFLGRFQTFDAVESFGVRLSRDFTAHLMGLEQTEVARIESKLASKRTDMDTPFKAVGRVLHDITKEIRLHPRHGAFSELVHFSEGGGLTDEQIITLARVIWFGGYVNLSSLLPSCLRWLCIRPELVGELRLRPERVASFVSEVMRLESPAQFITRKCSEDMDFAGYPFREGSMIWLCLAAANRDPSQFEHPDLLDLDRPPHRHLGFGFGEHACIGTLQARTIAEASVHRLVESYTTIRSLTSEQQVRYERSPFFRAIRRFIVALT